MEDAPIYGNKPEGKILHTPEPWIFKANGDGSFSVLTESNKWVIAFRQNGEMLDAKQQANAHRIIECVNACAGMDNPAAEISRLKKIEELLNEGGRIIVVGGNNPAMELKNEMRKAAFEGSDIGCLLPKLDSVEFELKRYPDFDMPFIQPEKHQYKKPSRPGRR